MRPTRNALRSGSAGYGARPANGMLWRRASLDVVPEIIHLHVVLRERGIVLLDQDFAQIERLPAHRDAGRGRKRADAHDRQIGVNAAVEEIEIEMTRHGSPPRRARTARAFSSTVWRCTCNRTRIGHD